MDPDKIYPAYLCSGKVVYLKQKLLNGQIIFIEVAAPASSTSTQFSAMPAVASSAQPAELHFIGGTSKPVKAANTVYCGYCRTENDQSSSTCKNCQKTLSHQTRLRGDFAFI
jgi:hypothetical protein